MSGSEHSQEGWHEEKRSAYLYRAMAEAETGTPRAELFNGLAIEAENQAGIWARQAGSAVPEFAPTCARAWLPRWCAATGRDRCARCW